MIAVSRHCNCFFDFYWIVLLFFCAYSCVRAGFNDSNSFNSEHEGVEVSKPSFKFSWSNLQVNHNVKVIIDIPAGSCSAGRLLGILGPSGSGKSTFLKSIASSLAGNLALNGHIFMNYTDGSFSLHRKADISFVHQEDSFFNMLTVQETLRLAMALRCLSDQEPSPESLLVNQRQLLDEVSTIMGLKKILQQSAGAISGGEKKRLSVACELLGNPKLLIADEPTSGLDSFQALQVVTALRGLARRQGIAAIATLHQPRSSIWLQCDDIMVFTPNGRIAFHGTREEVLGYLETINYSCPINVNPAEHLIDLVSVDPAASEENQMIARKRITNLEEQFLLHHSHSNRTNSQSKELLQPFTSKSKNDSSSSTVDEDNHSSSSLPTSSLPSSSLSSSNLYHDHRPLSRLFRGAKNLLLRLKRSLHRTVLLYRRALLQTLRDGKVNFIRLAVSALLATIVGSLYDSQNDNNYGGGGVGHDNGKMVMRIRQGTVSKRVNIVAQAVINVSMLAAVKTLQLFKAERPVVSRERSQGQYGAVEYLIAKAMAELPVDALVAAVFGFILHHRTHIASPRSSFIGLLSLLATVSASLGLAVGALLPFGDAALTAGPALMVIHVILGAIGPAGVRLDDDDGGNSNSSKARMEWKMKMILRPLLRLSPIRLACNALCCLEFADREVIGDNGDKDHKSYPLMPSLSSMARGILRGLSSHVVKGDHSKKRKKPYMKGGDHVLEALGIDQGVSSYHNSSLGLWRLLAGHLMVTLLGLLFIKGE